MALKRTPINESQLSYSDHYETLVALITYLAIASPEGRKDASNAPRLADHLGLDLDEVRNVLGKFKGLFRRSQETFSSSYGPEYRYVLQLRYARRKYIKGELADVGEPLSNEDLFSLLTFITDKVREEQEDKRQTRSNRVTMIGVWTAAILSFISATIALLK